MPGALAAEALASHSTRVHWPSGEIPSGSSYWSGASE